MKTFAKQCKLCMLAFKGKPRKPLHFGLVAFGITLARVRSRVDFQGGHSNTTSQINLDSRNCNLRKNLDLRNCNLRKNLNLRKIAPKTKILVHKLFDLRKIF